MSARLFGYCVLSLIAISAGGCATHKDSATADGETDAGVFDAEADADAAHSDANMIDAGDAADSDANMIDAGDAADFDASMIDAGDAADFDASMIDAGDAADFDDAGDAGGYNVAVPVTIVSTSLERRDENCDGVPETCITRSYDATERVVVTRTDDCAGSDAWCFSSIFNRDDHLLAVGKDEGCDGIPECPSFAHTYDTEGHNVHTEFHTGQPESLCASRRPFLCTTFVRPSPNVTRAERDSFCDGTLNYCETTHRDQAGNETYVERDYDCDGIPNGPDSCFVRMFDDAGHETASGADQDCDGVFDFACRVAIFDDAGHQTHGYRDSECDGVGDTECRRDTFDTAGHRTERFEDDDCDGVPERLVTRTYDELGNQTGQVAHDSEDSCAITSTYDTTGRLVNEAHGASCDNGPYCTVTSYSVDGRAHTSGRDAACDGVPESSCATLTYDDQDRLIGWRRDSDCNGTPDLACYTLEFDL